jgi:RNA polymerase sigma-70 factor (ECF subfamily)
MRRLVTCSCCCGNSEPTTPAATPTRTAAASARSPRSADRRSATTRHGFVTLRIIPTHLDDATLVTAAQGGDRNALDQLLRRHYDRIHGVCRRIAGTTRDADDACQEALIKIVRSLPSFDGRSSFGTWAYRIATNASLDEIRRRARRPGLHLVEDSVSGADPVDVDAAASVEQVGDRLLLDRAMAELPDELRAAVVLRDVADLDYAEIAEVLDVPVGTVKSRISRGRQHLARRLRLATADPDPEISAAEGNRGGPSDRPTEST